MTENLNKTRVERKVAKKTTMKISVNKKNIPKNTSNENEIAETIIEFLTGVPIKMNNVVRFTGINQLYPENISQHGHQVAMLCWLLARIEKEFGKEVDLGKLLTNAIFHDMEEVLGADLNHHFKNFNKEFKEFYEEVSYEFTFKNFYSMLFFKDELSDKKCVFKDKETLEGKILAVSDMLQLVGKSIVEIDSGNIGLLGPFWTGYKFLLKEEFKEVKGVSIIYPFLDAKINEWKKRYTAKIVNKEKN